jgi:hypothetical protein
MIYSIEIRGKGGIWRPLLRTRFPYVGFMIGYPIIKIKAYFRKRRFERTGGVV